MSREQKVKKEKRVCIQCFKLIEKWPAHCKGDSIKYCSVECKMKKSYKKLSQKPIRKVRVGKVRCKCLYCGLERVVYKVRSFKYCSVVCRNKHWWKIGKLKGKNNNGGEEREIEIDPIIIAKEIESDLYRSDQKEAIRLRLELIKQWGKLK